MSLDEHREYLADRARVSAFRRAISEVVRPGDVVLDLGCGTGVLGLLACQAGAKRVYAIDEGDMIQLAREICEANGFQDRIVHIKGFSTQMELPERVDIVVADQIGYFGFDAGICDYFSDAQKRFLKASGRIIPARIDLHVAPVEHEGMWNQVEFWKRSSAGLDFSPARSHAANTGHPVKYQLDHLLGKPAVIASLDPANSPATLLEIQASLVAKRKGTLHGIGGWFTAQLSKSVTMSNSPLARTRINRPNMFFPLNHSVTLVADDQVRVQMSIRVPDSIVTWNVEVWGTAPNVRGRQLRIRKFQEFHSTFHGMLLSKESLQKTRPDFVPKLNPWGEARRSVLELCDGKKPLQEIEREIYERHKSLFRSPHEASRFVCEVINSYTL